MGNFHVLLGSRDEARGAAAVGEIAEATRCDRIEFLPLDVSQDSSVTSAAQLVASKYGTESSLYAVVNNAGIGIGNTVRDTLNVNFFGPKRVCDAFIPLLCPSTGRIVNTSSASGPMFVANASRQQRSTRDAYGFSKACLNAYTVILAREHPNLLINAMT